MSNKIYSSFIFLKVLRDFKILVSNEKIAGKQEFENLIASSQEKIFLRTYCLTGLKSDFDILFWRMSDNLDLLQNISSRFFSTGIGKYFEQKASYLGMYEIKEEVKDIYSFMQNNFGIYKYLLVHPLIKNQIWYEMSHEERESLILEREKIIKNKNDLKENFFLSYGIDDSELIVVREAKDLDILIESSKELKKQRIKNYTLQDKPNYLCIGKDLREILDNLS